MKRPMLVSGIAMILISAFLMIFSKNGAIALLLTGALAFILYLIKPLKLRKLIIIPAVALSTLLICSSFLAYTHFKVEPAVKYDGNCYYLSGKIVTTPVNVNGNLSFVLKTEKIGNENESIKIDVTIPENDNNPHLYDYISLNADVNINRNEYNKYDLSAVADGIILKAYGNTINVLWECEKTPYYYCLYFREAVCNRIENYMLSDTGGILKGLIFGGSESIPSEIATAFRSSGITHLLAVSGLHTSLWCGLIIFIFNLFKIPVKIRNSFCIVFLICFCTVTGFTPSVLRSSFMSLLMLTSPFSEAEPDSLNSLGFATSILLLNNPYIIFSLSFQLSVCATLGVLLISRYETAVHKLFCKIRFKPVRKLLTYLICSFMISAGAGLFTAPVSAFYFDVLSVVSPVTNLLCVKPAFYAMICGTVATATSYIDIYFVKKFTFLLYDITDFLLSFVSGISLRISEFTYCTIPVHQSWLSNGLVCVAIIAGTGFLIFRIKKNGFILKASAILMILVLFINILTPLLPTPYRDTLTVLSDGNNLNVILRSGTHYAYLLNSADDYPPTVYNYLPKATCEKFDYWFITYATVPTCYSIEKFAAGMSPLETHVTPIINDICNRKNVMLPSNTIIDTDGKYSLNGKINFEIIDTYSVKYAIIKGDEKTVYIHLHGTTDFSSVVDTSQGDIFVYNSAIPDKVPATAETIIINGVSDYIINKDYNRLKTQTEDLYLTALNGDITINI